MKNVRSIMSQLIPYWQASDWLKRGAIVVGIMLGLLLFFRVASLVFWIIAGAVLLGLAWICRVLWRAFKHAGLTL